MKRILKSYKNFIKENVEVEPVVKPETKPVTTPRRSSPLRRNKPSVTPRPKASAEEVANKFLEMVKHNRAIMNIVSDKYYNPNKK